MTIGILGAMPEEVNKIKTLMTDIKSESFAGRDFLFGKINNCDVVLAVSYCGKVAAAVTVSILVLKYQIKQLLFTGVAGAVSPDVNIGDVVVSDKLYQHDMDATPVFEKHEIPLTGKTFFDADATLVTKAAEASQEVLANLAVTLDAKFIDEFALSNAKCHVGMITSGDQFITCETVTARIADERPGTLAVEMEGAAVAQVCHDLDIPFVIMRTISDKANSEAHLDFPKFIQEVASLYSLQILQRLLAAS